MPKAYENFIVMTEAISGLQDYDTYGNGNWIMNSLRFIFIFYYISMKTITTNDDLWYNKSFLIVNVFLKVYMAFSTLMKNSVIFKYSK